MPFCRHLNNSEKTPRLLQYPSLKKTFFYSLFFHRTSRVNDVRPWTQCAEQSRAKVSEIRDFGPNNVYLTPDSPTDRRAFLARQRQGSK